MQVSIESISSLERDLKVVVPEEQVLAKVQDKLLSMAKTVRMDGFRRGKVPLKIVQRHYGEQARQDVINELIKSSLNDAIIQEELQVASRPELRGFSMDSGEGLVFTARVEVLPEVSLNPLEKLEIEQPVCDIDDADIDKMLAVIRRQHGKAKVIGRKAANGDLVVVDFVGRIDGKTFAGGSGKDVNIELGAAKFIHGFEEGLTGVQAGDQRSLRLKFPAAYPRRDLADKDVEFEVEVKAVKELLIPELDDEFLATLNITEGGLDKLKTEVRDNMQREAEHAIKSRVRESVMEALYQANQIDLPPSLVTAEIEYIKSDSKGTSDRDKQNADQKVAEKDNNTLTEMARKKITLQFLFGDIVKTNNINVQPSQVRTMIENVASGYKDPTAMVNWYYADKERLAKVEALALEQSVIEWIMQRVRVRETRLSFDDLVNKVQAA